MYFLQIYFTQLSSRNYDIDQAKVEQWIKKILRDAPCREVGLRKKVKEGKKGLCYLFNYESNYCYCY